MEVFAQIFIDGIQASLGLLCKRTFDQSRVPTTLFSDNDMLRLSHVVPALKRVARAAGVDDPRVYYYETEEPPRAAAQLYGNIILQKLAVAPIAIIELDAYYRDAFDIFCWAIHAELQRQNEEAWQSQISAQFDGSPFLRPVRAQAS